MRTARDFDDGDIETGTRKVLDASIAHLAGRVRSRLTQARHAALDELRRRGSRGWRSPARLSRVLVPVAAIAAVAVVAVLVSRQPPAGVSQQLTASTVESAPSATVDEGGSAAMLAAATSDDIAFVLGEDPFEAAFGAEEPRT